jgi:tetratricopeptide (TPR) repeat protein
VSKPQLGKLKQLPPREQKTDFFASRKIPWNVSYPRNPYFTGREDILAQLHDTLMANQKTVLAQAISGLGGIGKTQTAVEYAYRYRDQYQAVLWATADTYQTLVSEFVAIARVLDLPEKDAQEQNQAVVEVKNWLEENSGWLLILDNADEPELVKDFIPLECKGHILLTSRARIFDSLLIQNPIKLEKMHPAEAKEFLLKRTGCQGIETEGMLSVEQLVYELDYLPLALEQAGAYIYKMQCTFRDYLASYKKRGFELLEKVKPVTGNYSKSVLTTWSLNFEQVEKISAASADLLRVSAFLNQDQIPLELFTLGAKELGPELSRVLDNADSLAMDELLESLAQYSLISRDIQAQTFDIHRMVQAVIQANMDEEERQLWAQRVVLVVNVAFPVVEFSNWLFCERLLSQAQTCAGLIERWSLEIDEATKLLNKVGIYLKEQARYTESEQLFQRALEIRGKVLGPEHLEVAISLNNLASLYFRQGKYLETEPLYQRALGILEKALGVEDPIVATCLNNLVSLYLGQCRWTEAEPLCQRALGIKEKALGFEHLEVVTCLNNLAALYEKQGRYKEAEPLFQRALVVCEKELGTEHPDVARGLNNLASLYSNQSRYSEAEPFFQRALIIREKALGAEHPDVANSLHNLAVLYEAQGRYGEAEPLFKRALEICEKVLGADSLYVANCLGNLAVLYNNQGKYMKAMPLHQRALLIREKILGTMHPDVAVSLRNYASLLRKIKRETEAIKLEKRAQAILKKHGRGNS